jgi:hypothetical protein
MLAVQLNKKMYKVPQEWNELSKQQLLYAMQILYGNMALQDAQIRLFKALLRIGWYRFWRLSLLWIEERLYLVDWILKDNNLTRQLMPIYWGFHGPASDFDNLTGAEFTFAENYFLKYRSDENNIESLNYLVATLYRPAKKKYNLKLNPEGDAREIFNPNLLDNYAKFTAHWPMPAKLAILTWYDGCRTRLTHLYPKVFGGGGETAQFGFWSIMRGVAEKGTHGSFEQVERMPIKIMMMELTELVLEGERLQKNKK